MDSKSKRSDTDISRRTVLTGAGALTGAAVLGGITAAGGADQNDDSDDESGTEGADEIADPSTIAHRGFGGLYPENTIAAMRGAVQADADAIEIDLMPCADGTPVVFHDPQLSGRPNGGLTDAKGIVWETDCGVVDSAEVRESEQTIPTLDELMDVIPSDVGITLEFKNPGTMDLLPNQDIDGDTLDQQKEIWRPFTESVLDIASDHDNDVMVAASREAAIATVREMNPDIPIAFFFSDSIDVGLEITREHDCEVIWPPINMIKPSPFWESPDYYVEDPDFEEVDLVEVAYEEGREIYVFTLNTGYEADQMRMAEVDGILSNYPSLLTYGEDPKDNADSVFEFDDDENEEG
jgi:glycerophosphoryl diester phosphodiesterase